MAGGPVAGPAGHLGSLVRLDQQLERSETPAVDQETLDRWRELVVVDRDGAAVGTISEFYLDWESG
jgi:hypothetical protein